jgi:hypothetical protein
MSDSVAAGAGSADTPDDQSVLARTLLALRAAVGRRDAVTVSLTLGAGYLLLYLATVGDLSVGGGRGLSVRTVEDLSLAFSTTGFFRFEAIALVELSGVTYLFSPLNLAVAAVLAGLVGANAGLSYLGLVQPRACGLEASSGAFASVPALLSGAACCGPSVLLLIGVQASASIVAGFQFLVPLALVLLVGSLLLVGRTVDPSLMDA